MTKKRQPPTNRVSPGESPSSGVWLTPQRGTVLFLAAFVGYMVLFYSTSLPSLPGNIDTGAMFRRVDFFQLLIVPEVLVEAWFGEPPRLALADRLPVLFAAASILITAAAAGWLALRLMRADRGLTRLETVVFSEAVGLNLVSLYVLAVGLGGWLGNRLVFVVPGVAVLAAALVCRARSTSPACSAPQASVQPAPQPPVVPDRFLWAAAPFVAIIILGAMLPPVDFDVREYHLQVPKEFFQQGRIDFLPHNVYGNMPLGAEMHSLLAMCLLGDWWLGALAGKTVLAAMTLLTALALLAAGRRFFSPAAGVVAAVVYLSIPWIVRVSTSGLVEGASAFYLLMSVYAVLLWREQGRGLPLAGFLAGAAVACKYPAALFVVLPLAAWVFVTGKGRGGMPALEGDGVARTLFRQTSRLLGLARPESVRVAQRPEEPTAQRQEAVRPSAFCRRCAWRPLAVFLLAAAVGCGPWFVKNWVLSGNPTYPLLYEVFDGRTRTPENNAQWLRAHLPPNFSAADLVGRVADVAWRSEWLSPLVVPLAVMALIPARRRRLAAGLWLYFGYVLAAWWLATHRIDRFWIPALPVLALLAGVGATWTASLAWRRVLLIVLSLGLVANFLVVASGPGGYNRYFVPLDELRRDPNRVDPWHAWLNRHVPPGHKVLMVGDAQVFDLEVPVLYNTCFDPSIFESLVRDCTPDEIRAALAARHISHVFVHWSEIARYRSPGNYGFTDFVQPGVFDKLVRQGVLEPLPPIEDNSGRCYRVVRST
ncbi:MAG: glycosyltransferase family 39 protein [Pirellulales bacterium]